MNMEMSIVTTFCDFGHNYFKKQPFWPFFYQDFSLAISYEKIWQPWCCFRKINKKVYANQVSCCAVQQGFSNFWCYGAHEEIDHNLRSPRINFINAVIASLDSCKISQVSILISKRIAHGAPRFLSRNPGAPYGAL